MGGTFRKVLNKMADSSGPRKVNTPTSSKNKECQQKFVLTEEEKAVLLDCRTKSISRGLPLAIGGVLGLRFLLNLERLPSFVQRYRPLFYMGVFIGCFTTGVNSYKTTCMNNIMSLDNSRLADQLRETLKKENISLPEKWKQQDNLKSVSRRPDIILDDKEKEDSGDSRSDSSPEAFGQSSTPAITSGDNDSNSLYGKTFDEIREENRKKQINQQSFRRGGNREGVRSNNRRGDEQPSYSDSGKPKAAKRNKYGDIVYDDD